MTTRKKIRISVIIIVAFIAIIATVLICFKLSNKAVLADKAELKSMYSSIADNIDDFKTTDDIRDGITSWADSEKLNYSVDKNQNIIFKLKPSKKHKLTPSTIICVTYSLFSLEDNAYAIAMAEYIAKHGINGTKGEVIFLNNARNNQEGARNISNKHFPSGSNILYLDSGSSTYMSTQSFAQCMTDISIPYKTASVKCDTAVKVKLTGITPDSPSGTISDRLNPISTLNSVLMKLNDKAVTFQLADVNVENNGNLYPAGIEFTILVNSYSVETLTKYLDKKIEDYNDQYDKDLPALQFSYEVSDNPDSKLFPKKAYSDKTTRNLFNLIYTVKNGTYKFKEENTPDGFERGQIYGINCLENITIDGDSLILTLNTAALSTLYFDEISKDNTTAASLSNAVIILRDTAPEFNNISQDFSSYINYAYSKVNNNTSKDATIKLKFDSYFTPCSYLMSMNTDLDTVHLKANRKSYYKLTNAIMNYNTCYVPPWN